MGARPPNNSLGLKTTHCAIGGDAWRVTENISLLAAMALCSYGGCVKKP